MRKRAAGFTIVELTITMVIIGLLAALALPRFTDQAIFNQRGFHGEALAALRYAQKTAVAQRRNVCVTFAADSITLTIAPGFGVAGCNTDLAGPDGVAPYTITGRSGVLFAAVPANFAFDPLGRASIGQTIQITGIAQTIRVEQETGYVYPS